ncbi:MAG: DNA-formamidopyrimidine glycosylase family protein, partial [Alphaproteobacteria bacterium]
MPELPDVEVLRQYLEANALNRRIRGVSVTDARILADLTPARLSKALTGARMDATRRHGKHLLARLDRGGWLT